MVTKKDIIEKIRREHRLTSCLYEGNGLVQRKGRFRVQAVADFYKNATEEERKAMQEITAKELWGMAAKDVMLFDMLKRKKKKGRWS